MCMRIYCLRFINLFGLKGVGAILAFCGPDQRGSLALARALTSWQTSATRSRDVNLRHSRANDNGDPRYGKRHAAFSQEINSLRSCFWKEIIALQFLEYIVNLKGPFKNSKFRIF